MKTKKSKIKTINEIKIKTKTAGRSDKKTEFKPKAWAVKFLKEHKVLMDLLKDK